MTTKTVSVIKKDVIVMLPLASISNKFDVRVSIDNDRVLQFAGLYEGGVSLPPIRVVKIDEDKYAYIDGRHRGAARAYLNLKDAPSVICNGSLRDNPFELFAEALESNWGGAKPPTRDDISHTIVRMIESGGSQKAIRDRLSFLPPGSCRMYIASAKSTVAKRRLSRALDGVSEGLSLSRAAEQNQIKIGLLRDAISGKRGRWGKNRTTEKELEIELKSYISNALLSANAGIGKKLQELLKKVDDGEVSAKIASGVIKAWRDHLRKTGLRVDDWQSRLDAISSEQDRAVNTEAEAASVSA